MSDCFRSRTTLVLLPGMDGTGLLFRPLLDVLPASVTTTVVHYPHHKKTSYRELMAIAYQQLPPSPCVILGESFSSPIAMELASAYPEQVKAVVLCAGFVKCPRGVPRGLLGSPLLHGLMRLNPPEWVLKWMLLGRDAPPPLVHLLKEVLASLRPEVLVNRIAAISDLDVSSAVRRCSVPVLYLQATRDRPVSNRSLSYLLSIRPDIEVKRIDGPHLLLQREPQSCWDAVLRFLDELERSATLESRVAT